MLNQVNTRLLGLTGNDCLTFRHTANNYQEASKFWIKVFFCSSVDTLDLNYSGGTQSFITIVSYSLDEKLWVFLLKFESSSVQASNQSLILVCRLTNFVYYH